MARRMLFKIVCANPRPLETIVAFEFLLWGIYLMLPLATFPSSTAYSIMSRLASEEIWGVYFITIGVAQLVFVHLRYLAARRLIAWVVMFSWIFVDIGFWASGSTSAATITYATFAIVAIWSVVALSGAGKANCSEP